MALLVVAGAAAVGGAQEPEYVDDDGSVHEESLRLLQQVGVLAGSACGPDAICPKDPIDRTMMAVWVIRARDHVLLTHLEPGHAEWEPHSFLDDLSFYALLTGRFADAKTLPFALWPYPGRLYSEGISAGCRLDPLRYCPDSPVTREQMASFLVRAFDLEEATAAGFSDVDEEGVHAGAIDALAASGVTAGCSADPLLFCPYDSVTRGQMATFLVRAMSLWFPQDASELIDCEDFPTRADAQVFLDRYKAYGDFAGLDDGQFPGIACENRPGTWYFRKDVDALTDEVSYWVNTEGTRDVGTEDGISGPYLGVSCWVPFVNLRQDYDEETVEVEYRFYPDTEVISETWTVSKEGRSTFLIPPDESKVSSLEGLGADGAEELRMKVEYETYRFPIDDYAVASSWLWASCSAGS